MTVQKTLKQRGERYGSFSDVAQTAHTLKAITQEATERNKHDFSPIHLEALSMIEHKIARIVNGDPNYIDSWHDIAGYATLVVEELEK